MEKNLAIIKYGLDKIAPSSRIIIYGAGDIGKCVYEALKQRGLNVGVLCFLDKDTAVEHFSSVDGHKAVYGTKVLHPDDIDSQGEYNYIIVASIRYADEIERYLINTGVEKDKIIAPIKMDYEERYEKLNGLFSTKE